MSDLSGVTVVVTRPAHQADPLCRLIEDAGGQVLRLPVIEIAPPEDPQHCRTQLARLAEFDLAIFVSANAVDAALALLPSAQAWPSELAIAAVGRATARALEAKGLDAKLVAPEPYNSEALLSLPELQSLDGQRVLILRGKGGRAYLGWQLSDRGADVEYLECYLRVRPASDTRPLIAAWEQRHTLPIVVTSNEGLENLRAMIDEAHRPALLASPLVVISERTARHAEKLGFEHPALVARAANDTAIVEALANWARQHT